MWQSVMMKILAVLFLAFGLPAVALAQSTVAPPTGVQSAPLAPPPGVSPPAVTPPAAETRPVEAPPAVATPVLPAPDPNTTLAGKPGDPSDIDEIMLAGKPVAIIAGQTTWDQGFQQLQSVFSKLKAETAREGLKIAGRPLTLFIETDDIGTP